MNAKSKSGDTALHAAATSDEYVSTVQLLISAGADVNAKRIGLGTPLYVAALAGSENVARTVVEHGADLESHEELGGGTPLDAAASLGQIGVARLLLDAGANTGARAATGATPLHSAALAEQAEIVALLLDGGADVNARTEDGATPLHMAASYCAATKGSFGRAAVTRLLIAHGAEVNATDKEGHTPLDAALQVGDTPVVQILKEHGAVEGRPLPPCK